MIATIARKFDDKKSANTRFSSDISQALWQRSTTWRKKKIILGNFLIARYKRFNLVALARITEEDIMELEKGWRRNVVGPLEETYIPRAVWKVASIESRVNATHVRSCALSPSLDNYFSNFSQKQRLSRDRFSFVSFISHCIRSFRVHTHMRVST